jgi:AcrR family transcriptional regulator
MPVAHQAAGDSRDGVVAALFGGPEPQGSSSPDDAITERILDAALAQFTEFGMRRTSVDDVARRAGVTRVTVYRRFRTRDLLIGATIHREYMRFLDILDPAIKGLPAMEERVTEGFLVTLRHVQSHPLIGGLLRTEPELVLPALTVNGGPGLIAMRGYLTRSFERFQRDAGRPGPDPGPAAELMVRIVVSFLLNPTSCIELSDDEAVRSFARRFLAPLLQC